MSKKTTKQNIPNTPLRFLWYMTKPHKRYALFSFLLVFLASMFSDIAPYMFKKIIDSATLTMTASSSDFGDTWFWVMVYSATFALMYASWRASGLVGMHWATRTQETATNQLFQYLTSHSHSYFSNRFAGSLTGKVAAAANGTTKLVENILWNYFSTIITLIITGILMFTANVYVGSIYVVLVLVLVVVNFFFVKHRRPFVIKMAAEHSILRGQAVDVVTNIQAMSQFARRTHELKLLEKQTGKVKVADVKQWSLNEYSVMVNNVIVILAVVVMLSLMLRLLSTGAVTLGDFVMVITLMFSLSGTLTFIGNMMNGFVRTYAHIEEGLGEILVKHDLTNDTDAKALKIDTATIEFKDTTFTYNDDPIFQKFNLVVPAGQKLGVVGPSGAGKTTLISLIMRQFDIEDGSLTIDGQEISSVTQDSLRENIGIVPQDPLLFHRSIRENIRYGSLNATDEEVEEAARAAQAHKFILEAPQGYDTTVGERGIKLSGGQKQRVAIARAILKNAPILILDEATSSLDSESEVEIQKALQVLMEGKTVLAIAHRFSTIREMDRIIVMEAGKIVQDGNHDSLVEEKEDLYARLWAHQSDGFI